MRQHVPHGSGACRTLNPGGPMLTKLSKQAINGILDKFGYAVVRKPRSSATNHYDFHSSVVAFCRGISSRGFDPQRILDVGANKGYWSRAVREVFPRAAFTLIEPQVELKPELDRFCAETATARWINAGAGASEGELLLTVFPDNVSSSFALLAEDASRFGLPQRRVRVTTIDAVCRESGGSPDILKIDAEGFEYEILRGASTVLGHTEVILLELSLLGLHAKAKAFHEMISIMADLGYLAYDFTTSLPRPLDGALAICEVAFARKHGVLRSNLSWM